MRPKLKVRSPSEVETTVHQIVPRKAYEKAPQCPQVLPPVWVPWEAWLPKLISNIPADHDEDERGGQESGRCTEQGTAPRHIGLRQQTKIRAKRIQTHQFRML
jgi:hypothetical protein